MTDSREQDLRCSPLRFLKNRNVCYVYMEWIESEWDICKMFFSGCFWEVNFGGRGERVYSNSLYLEYIV